MQQFGRWILDWQDRSRDPNRRVLVTADSVDEVRDSIERILSGETWTPPQADSILGLESLPAYRAFQDEVMDLTDDAQILDLWSTVRFECDDGVFEIIRER